MRERERERQGEGAAAMGAYPSIYQIDKGCLFPFGQYVLSGPSEPPSKTADMDILQFKYIIRGLKAFLPPKPKVMFNHKEKVCLEQRTKRTYLRRNKQ